MRASAVPSAFRTASLSGPNGQWCIGEQALLGAGDRENTSGIQPTPHGWLGEALLSVYPSLNIQVPLAFLTGTSFEAIGVSGTSSSADPESWRLNPLPCNPQKLLLLELCPPPLLAGSTSSSAAAAARLRQALSNSASELGVTRQDPWATG